MGWLRPPYRRDQCPEGPVLEGSPPPFQYPSSQNPTPLKPRVEEGISAQGTLPPLTTTDLWLQGTEHRPVARSGKGGFENYKCGPKVGVDHQKGVGVGGGCAPPARSAEAFENIDFATECKPICRHMYKYTHTKLNTSRSGSSIFFST